MYKLISILLTTWGDPCISLNSSLCAYLSSLVLCPENCRHLDLTRPFGSSPQIRLCSAFHLSSSSCAMSGNASGHYTGTLRDLTSFGSNFSGITIPHFWCPGSYKWSLMAFVCCRQKGIINLILFIWSWSEVKVNWGAFILKYYFGPIF